jgi:hypothetical protein
MRRMSQPTDTPVSPRQIAGPVRRMHVHLPGDPGRAAVERFVADIYQRRFGACVPRWAPRLASLVEDGRIVAAAGWRDGGEGELYLERYLPSPVEACIAAAASIDQPERRHVAEVGHLAAARPGAGRVLMLDLAARLGARGYRWVVSTVTPALQASFGRMGVRSVVLGAAHARDAGPDAAAWGRYYDDGPVVVAGEPMANLVRLVRPGSDR